MYINLLFYFFQTNQHNERFKQVILQQTSQYFFLKHQLTSKTKKQPY